MTYKPWVAGMIVGVTFATGPGWLAPAFGQGTPSPPGFARVEDSPYLVLRWNCQKSDPRSLVLEGIAEVPFRTATNIYYGELTLVGLDAKGRRVSVATSYLPPVIYISQSVPISVTLALTGTEARVDLYYSFDLTTNRGGNADRRAQLRPRVIPVGRASYQWSVEKACPAA